MAIISVRHTKGRYTVSVHGALGAADLGRLERACGPALELKVAPLELCLDESGTLDGVAAAFVERLRSRGAVIRRPAGLRSESGRPGGPSSGTPDPRR